MCHDWIYVEWEWDVHFDEATNNHYFCSVPVTWHICDISDCCCSICVFCVVCWGDCCWTGWNGGDEERSSSLYVEWHNQSPNILTTLNASSIMPMLVNEWNRRSCGCVRLNNVVLSKVEDYRLVKVGWCSHCLSPHSLTSDNRQIQYSRFWWF